MALADLLERLERRTDTPDTPCNPGEVSAKAASMQARTLDTADTPQGGNSHSDSILEIGCASCTHSRKPGGVSRYCSARPDLPPAYGEEHPLRLLPDDGGEGCGQWVKR